MIFHSIATKMANTMRNRRPYSCYYLLFYGMRKVHGIWLFLAPLPENDRNDKGLDVHTVFLHARPRVDSLLDRATESTSALAW